MSNTNKQKKPSVLKRSLHYAGKKRYMLPLAMVFSALSGILVLMPMVYIHKIVSGIILSGSVDGGAIRYYAILAASFAAAGMLLYFCALMVSHLFAFEVESNIIKLSVKKMMAKPLGFFAKWQSPQDDCRWGWRDPHDAGTSVARPRHDDCFAHRAIGLLLPFRLAAWSSEPCSDGHNRAIDGDYGDPKEQ